MHRQLRVTGRGTCRAPYPPQAFSCLQSYLFLNKKTRRLYHQRKRPAKIAWTVTYRKQHRKVSPGGCMRSRWLQRSGHMQAELPPGCRPGWRLGLLCATGLPTSRRRLLSIILLPPCARRSRLLSGNSCLLHIDPSSGQQLWDGSFAFRHAHTVHRALMTAGLPVRQRLGRQTHAGDSTIGPGAALAGHGGCGDPQEAAHCAQGICARDQRGHPGGAPEAPAGEARAAQAAAGRGCQVRCWVALMCAVRISILSGAALSSSVVRPAPLGSAF